LATGSRYRQWLLDGDDCVSQRWKLTQNRTGNHPKTKMLSGVESSMIDYQHSA
jgi:hypothetical protein